MPPVKDPQSGSQGMPDAEDTLIGDWDPYVASIVESAQDQETPAKRDPVAPVRQADTRSGSVCRRAQLLSDKND